MVRPKATELKRRCKAPSRNTGEQCGSPAAAGLDVCTAHIAGKAEIKRQASTGERLARLTEKALNELDRILDEGLDDAKLRAIKIVVDRSLPVSGPHALTVNVLAPGAVDGRMVTAADRVRARLDALAERHRQAEIRESAEFDPDAVIDAEIVSDDRHVVQQPISEEFGATFGREFGHVQDGTEEKMRAAG
jgi:hypothetical protein